GADGGRGLGRRRGRRRREALLRHRRYARVALIVGSAAARRGLEGDPAVAAQVHLGPRVGVAVEDTELAGRDLLARCEADGDAAGKVDGPCHRRVRPGELLAVAALGDEQETLEGVVAVA